jgi:ceramide glucosyltransferase
MQWEAIAINADFWSQVLQSRSLKPLDFALGAVMVVRRRQLEEIGGFNGLKDCLADDYQLGNRLARRGYVLELSPIVVECCSEPMDWIAVWKHQLRWARTIRVCQPGPYFFSILSNPTLWPLLWVAICPGAPALAFLGASWVVRVLVALNLQKRLRPPLSDPSDRSDQSDPSASLTWLLLVPLKDLLQAALWLMAYLGNHVEWRGQRLRLRRDGTLEKYLPGP